MSSRQQKNFGHTFGRYPRRAYFLGYPAISIALTLVCAGIIGLVLYAAGGLSYLSNSPGDRLFADQNDCLIRALSGSAGEGSRLGFVISPDGDLAASYGVARIAICSRRGALQRVAERSGISAASFDFGNRLWLSWRQGTALAVTWVGSDKSQENESLSFGGPWDSIVGLAGHREGVAILDDRGRLVSMSPTGAVLGHAELPIRGTAAAEIVSNSDGTLVSIALEKVLFVYRAADLSLVQQQAPCEVRFVWWTSRPNEAILGCDSEAGVALLFDTVTGSVELLPGKPRIHSRFIPGLAAYVQPCENLPCRAMPP